MKRFLLIAICTLYCLSAFAQSNEKFKGWKKAETEHFTFIFEESSRETTEAYASIADNAWNKIANIYSIPKNHFNVYVTDRTNTVNAFTYFSPTEIGMFTTPPAYNTFGFRTDWRELFFTHELIHGANLTLEDKSNFLSILFGPFWKTYDFSAVPGWAMEGLTTVLETELTEGGRGRSPYFELEYKALALENSLISYNQIGLELEPPRGQSYVMGYLIMRSIADRWGIQALADIERNRNLWVSWEDSVKIVTGCTPDEIYRDVKIALTKKYAKERFIPEGATISPRIVNANYYNPAYVYEDGSLITLRTQNNNYAVVKLDPSLKSGSNYYELSDKEKETAFKETILFEGLFQDSISITADENGTVYAAMGTINRHKIPGTSVEYAIYKWTKEHKLQQLTSNGSYFQPSVSMDGSTLVAIRQYGLNYSLVKIDTETGKETVLLQNPSLSFIQPAVNKDGTTVAFMESDCKRAKICVLSLENGNADYKVIYNGYGNITDPSAPFWNDDKLTFTDNKRGRLERYEVSSDGNILPVVADPSGVLWACKNSRGVYYTTYSGTGYVIKIKPESEWGNVPQENGPSMPGEIITFGKLEADYPDFKPYEIETKEIKHRSEENIKKLENLAEPKTVLSNEKNYIPFSRPLFYLPIISSVKDSKDTYLGFGATLFARSPMLQMNSGYLIADCIYYPDVNNFSGNFYIGQPLPLGTLGIFFDRFLTDKMTKNGTELNERNALELSYELPLYTRNSYRNNTIFNLIADAVLGNSYTSPDKFAAFNAPEYISDFSTLIGISYYNAKNQLGRTITLSSDLYNINLYSFDKNKWYFGVESETSVNYALNAFGISLDGIANIRYTDFPAENDVPKSLVKFNGSLLDTSYPGRAAFQVGLSSLDKIFNSGLSLRIYEEALASWDNDFYFLFNDMYATGIEVTMTSEGVKIAFGYNFITDFSSNPLDTGKFYFTIKSGAFRF